MNGQAKHSQISPSKIAACSIVLGTTPSGRGKNHFSAQARLGASALHDCENDPSQGNSGVVVEQTNGRADTEALSPTPRRQEGGRGPLKKRTTTPVPLHAKSWTSPPKLTPLASTARSGSQIVPSAPLLRQTSSTFSAYSHHKHVPAQFCLTSTAGHKLMSQPLVGTPHTLMVSAPVSTSHSVAQATDGLGPSTPELSHRDATAGLDLLADQVLMDNCAFYPVATAARLQEGSSQQVFSKPMQAMPMYYAPPPQVHFSRMPDPYMPDPGYYVRPHSEIRRQDVHNPKNGCVHKIPLSERKATSHKAKGKPPVTIAFPRTQDPTTTYPMLFGQAPTTSRPCSCANSKCLKLYCECFRRAVLCDSNLCSCKNCKNNEKNNVSKGAREYAILRILAKRPDAFSAKNMKPRYASRCKCQKNNCLKKYCDCVARRRYCAEDCKCRNCGNSTLKKE